VVRIALQNGASIAGLLITTEAMVAEKPKKEAPMPAMPPGGGWTINYQSFDNTIRPGHCSGSFYGTKEGFTRGFELRRTAVVPHALGYEQG
jgi:hypothetical protein